MCRIRFRRNAFKASHRLGNGYGVYDVRVDSRDKEEVNGLVKKYIDDSTGIQTILQMRWLAETVESAAVKPLTLEIIKRSI